MWQCSYCPFTSSRKWNIQVHEKRKHQVQLSTSNDNEHQPGQLGQTLMSDHNYIQGQQAGVQQQGGQVQVLHRQHDRNPLLPLHHAQVHQHYKQPSQEHQRFEEQQINSQTYGPQKNKNITDRSMSQGIEIEYDGYGKNVIVKEMEFLMEKANIEYILQNKKDFLGCFPMDRLPPFPSVFPKSMIINTQKSSQPGEHWVALVLTEKKCYYFDSFGWPIMEENILRYLEPHYEKNNLL